MKSNLLVGASVIALGLAMTPALADDIDVSTDDTANGNGILNDTQTDIEGTAINSPQTGSGNFDGDVASNNGVSIDVEVDPDGNGLANDTFQNTGDANNAPQTGIANVGGNALSDNTLTDNSNEFNHSAAGADDVANDGGTIDNNYANNSSIGVNDSEDAAVAGHLALDESEIDNSMAASGTNAANNESSASGNATATATDSQANSNDSDYNVNAGENAMANSGSNGNAQADAGSVSVAGSDHTVADDMSIAASDGADVAGGDIAGGSIDKNNATDSAVIVNDSNDTNVAGEDIATDAAIVDNSTSEGAAATATSGGFALSINDVSLEIQTDVVASNTELNAYNVLNIGSGNAIYSEGSSAELTADATISGGATDSVMVQMSANSGANAITQQSQTVTANIDNLTVN